MNKQTLIPTQLFIGQQDFLIEETEKLLLANFCKTKEEGCFCSQCRKIKNNQHESVVWLNPEKDYSVKDIQVIFEKIGFALDESENFFFVLQKAHTLNNTCANRLLKVLEEPPTGYNFILHTNNINLILPTIVSRCHIINYSSKSDETQTTHPLLHFFCNNKLDDPINFEKELKKHGLTDSQSIELANDLLSFFAQKIIDFYSKESEDEALHTSIHQPSQKLRPALSMSANEQIKYYKEVIEYLKERLKKPPQSGSSNLFWKNMYLSFPSKVRSYGSTSSPRTGLE